MLPGAVSAQETTPYRKLPLVLTAGNHAVSMPFYRVLRLPYHPAFSVGTEFTYRRGEHGQLLQTLSVGGFYNRYNATGLTVQVGCQVGESSLLSAAHLILVSGVRQVTYAEGCFGAHLLREDPAQPMLQFGYGGRPPQLVDGPGLGVQIDESVLSRWTGQRAVVQ